MEYDDSIVRQMVECIKVYPGGKLEIIFGGGYLVEESVYVKAHTQFKGKKMTVSAVIEYIASHEGWRAEQRSKTTKEKSE